MKLAAVFLALPPPLPHPTRRTTILIAMERVDPGLPD